MSMGVGYAMRFKHSDLLLAIEEVSALRDKARKAQNSHLAQKFAAIAEWELVRRYRFNHQLVDGPVSRAFKEYTDAKREPVNKIDYCGSKWDTTFDLMLYWITCPVNGDSVILGKSIVGQKHFHDLLMRNLPVVDWHYQDSTDRPAHITASTWRLRRKQWEEALPGVGVPMDNGLMVRLGYGEPPWPELKDVQKFLKLEGIVERSARRIIQADRFAAMSAAEPKARGGGFSLGPLIRRGEAVREWMTTAEGMTAIVEEQFRLAECLPEKLTREHLTK